MSKKYVIEIKPEYEDTIRGIMVLGARDSNLYMDALAVEDLKELNSDYINEHYGSLQDDAYQRGLEDGKQTAVGAAELREKLEYQKGFEKGKDVRIKGCEGCMYQDTTIEHNPCNLCCNAFLNRWTAKKKADDEIKVGDEVEIIGTGNKFFIVGYEDDCICGFAYGGKTCRVDPVFAKKTGKHIDLNSILEEMKNESQKSNE